MTSFWLVRCEMAVGGRLLCKTLIERYRIGFSRVWGSGKVGGGRGCGISPDNGDWNETCRFRDKSQLGHVQKYLYSVLVC